MPDFGSQDYWETRFANDAYSFDWLLPVKTFLEFVGKWAPPNEIRKAEVLHIGCGTSDSSLLRNVVAEPRQIHNIDFSQSAIDAASLREKRNLEDDAVQEPQRDSTNQSVDLPETEQLMRWSCSDLLSLHSALDLLKRQQEFGQLYDLVLDKSTSDSIACASTVQTTLPYALSIDGWTRGISHSTVNQHIDVHPLHVLAVHLAALTRPTTGQWIALSYAEDRFPFLQPYPQTESHGLLPDSTIKAGFPNPSRLWRLGAKQEIVKEETLAERKRRMSSGALYRPKTSYWLYVLVRTDALITY